MPPDEIRAPAVPGPANPTPGGVDLAVGADRLRWASKWASRGGHPDPSADQAIDAHFQALWDTFSPPKEAGDRIPGLSGFPPTHVDLGRATTVARGVPPAGPAARPQTRPSAHLRLASADLPNRPIGRGEIPRRGGTSNTGPWVTVAPAVAGDSIRPGSRAADSRPTDMVVFA